MAGPQRFPFVQLDLAGTVGLDDGRYLAREPERVLVVRVSGLPAPRRRRLRRAKPVHADSGARVETVPLTSLTAITPEELGEENAATSWLEALRGDEEATKAVIADALLLINEAVHASRAATLDAHRADIDAEHALAVRIGFGSGDELADGRWEEAIEIPHGERRRRAEVLRPQERIAAVLGDRERVAACELLVLRARADIDAARTREAALQVRIGLEALLAEREAFATSGQEEDLAALGERRKITGEAANQALSGELSDERAAEVVETLELCERVLRRKRALG